MPAKPSCLAKTDLKAQSGMSAATFMLTAVPIMLLFMGVVELSNYFLQRYYMSTALLETARQASVNNANPETIFEVFNRQSKAAEKRIGSKYSVPDWMIYIESPDYRAFSDFNNPQLPIARQTGLPAIDNDYQQEQTLRDTAARGSGQNIFQANTLTLRLIQPHKPLLPGLSTLIRQFSSDDPAKQTYFSHGLMTQDMRIDITMQSHPVLWPDHPSGQVKRAGRQSQMLASGTFTGSKNAGQDCLGIWCDETPASSTGQITTISEQQLQHYDSDNFKSTFMDPPQNQSHIVLKGDVEEELPINNADNAEMDGIEDSAGDNSENLAGADQKPADKNSFIDLTTSSNSPKSCPAFMCCNPNALDHETEDDDAA